jgi:anionic cell wall polymer biosynthesis LytR-Cps2A-Psr (LCP) family protein
MKFSFPTIVRLRARAAMSPTVLGIMDRDSWTANTDNIVVADPRRRRLLWIPRDLWSDAVGDRINQAYGRGGHELFLAAVRELGIPVEASVVLLRSAVENALSGLRISVPVDRPRRYWYPLEPTLRLQDGAKLVVFEPPQETLVGERIHQWVGARRSADTPPPKLPDLDRIERQQILVRRLLEEGFDFSTTLANPALVAVSGATALEQLGAVGQGWALRTYDRVEPVTIDRKMVLVRHRSRLQAIRMWARRS